MFVVTAILSCVIKIRGLFKSTKWRHFENVKFEALSARRVGRSFLKWSMIGPGNSGFLPVSSEMRDSLV